MSRNSPWLARFLSDFTLGFSDGLTVPFALTAGLSSLGRTDTVILAGLAELCAGSISMGISGYLSARDEVPRITSNDGKVEDEEEELKTTLLRQAGDEGLVRQYLEPLALPGDMVDDIMAHLLADSARGLDVVAHKIVAARNDDDDDDDDDDRAEHLRNPVVSGLFIALGYVVGGLIPLLPYLFAETVGLALRWSIGLCSVALFGFGAAKGWLLRRGRGASKLRPCLWEGAQMLVLGGLAAGAAVLCVAMVGGQSQSAEAV